MQECRLAARDLACQRGDALLFAGVSFALEPGQALQVTGRNGVGKSSLLRLLAGLLRPFAGEVERSGMAALVDERPALDPEAPLGKALGFWQRIDGSHDFELERLGLGDLLDVPVGYLSTGQKKRAALARLIGQDAPVWLLDEPLNGLDVGAADMALDLVAQHCRAGGVAVIASHQPFALPGLLRIDLESFAP